MELTPAMFHILLALVDKPCHGYAVMQQVESSTRGHIRLPPGTLYRTIKRLLQEELIDHAEAPEGEEDADERRRYYALTPAGHRAAAAEAGRLADIVRLARSKDLIEHGEGV